MMRIARVMAYAGGAVLIAITVITCVSIAGRAILTLSTMPAIGGTMPWFRDMVSSLGIGPVSGDFELVESGVAFAVFAFLPWCQLNRGHAVVDLMKPVFGPSGNRAIDAVSETLMTAVLILIAWRLGVGTADKARYGETSFILQYPVWIAFGASFAAAAIAAVVSTYMTVIRWRELAGGRDILAGGGPQH